MNNKIYNKGIKKFSKKVNFFFCLTFLFSRFCLSENKLK